MNKIYIPLIALASAVSITIPNITAFACNENIDKNIEYNNIVGYNYSKSVGYYLEKEIPQGLEFVIIGEDLDSSNSKMFSQIGLSDMRGGSFYDPATPIMKSSDHGTLFGVWWGGFLDDAFMDGAVAAATKATSNSTQGKASVKPGSDASWVSSSWGNQNQRVGIMAEKALYGNQAAWDLR